MELTPKRKEELAKLAQRVVVPSLGILATRYVYVHRGEITGYIQYQVKNKGFIAGLSKGKDMVVSQFSGRFLDDGNVDIELSNLREEEDQEVEDFFKSPLE